MPMIASIVIGKGNIDAVLMDRQELEYIIACEDVLEDIKLKERPDLKSSN